jgi:L-rhamnose-H+ transport protein
MSFMIANPILGIFLHAIGGFAAGSFYAPLKRVQKWSWESFWLIMGLSAWLAAPWCVALLTTPQLFRVLSASPGKAWALCVVFGILWGLGNLTFGLSVRYLGMALGYSVALGFCMTFGTLIPPIAEGRLAAILATTSGLAIVCGVICCLFGIGMCGWAGMNKERELTDKQKRHAVREFALGRGFGVAAMAGILSACFAFGLAAGEPIAELSIEHGTKPIFSNNAVLVVILLGGFFSNAIWCLILNAQKRSFGDYVSGPLTQQISNYSLSALGGLIWYGQFFFYGMGQTKLGEKYDFSSWSIHMAFIIVFSNLWGIVFREWDGTSAKTKTLVWAGILTLIVSTMIIGYGNYLAN